MQSVLGAQRLIPVTLAVLMACIAPWVASAQSSKAPPQPLYLPDPTPRPPDLERKYSDDPVERAKMQQAALLRSAERRQQVVLATDKLVQLAQELKDALDKSDKNTAMAPNAGKAEEIEKLAKSVKEKMRAR